MEDVWDAADSHEYIRSKNGTHRNSSGRRTTDQKEQVEQMLMWGMKQENTHANKCNGAIGMNQ
jgi:hypothetical protein